MYALCGAVSGRISSKILHIASPWERAKQALLLIGQSEREQSAAGTSTTDRQPALSSIDESESHQSRRIASQFWAFDASPRTNQAAPESVRLPMG